MFMVSVNHLVLLQLCPFSDFKSRASLLNGAWGILELLSFDRIPVVSLLHRHGTVVDGNFIRCTVSGWGLMVDFEA